MRTHTEHVPLEHVQYESPIARDLREIIQSSIHIHNITFYAYIDSIRRIPLSMTSVHDVMV